MAVAKWEAPTTLSNLIDIDGGLAADAWAQSAIQNNSVAGDLYLDLSVALAAAVTAGATAPRIDVYLLPSYDGTTLPDPPGGSAGLVPPHYFAGSITANTSAGFTRGALRGIVLPPGHWAVAIQNRLGVSIGAANHTINGYAYGEEA